MLGVADEGVPITVSRSAPWRRLVLPVVVMAVVGVIALGLSASGQRNELVGSGSTLAQPLIEQAAADFRQARTADDPERPEETGHDQVVTGSGIRYEPVGSLSGIMRLSDPEVDFAVSDYPLSAGGLEEVGAAQFPVALGSIAVVHDLDLREPLRLDATTLADVYLGDLTRWDDPAIAELNPGLELPDLPITPVHRSDGSGSTHGLTAYLTAEAEEWAELGTGTQLDWPVGPGVERSSGMIDEVEKSEGALGYVEYGQAERAGLAIAELANAQGAYVAPGDTTMRAAVADVEWSAEDHFAWSAADADDSAAYPMTVAIYALLRTDADADDTAPGLHFLSFLLDDFDTEATDLGYLPLPGPAVTEVRSEWERRYGFTS